MPSLPLDLHYVALVLELIGISAAVHAIVTVRTAQGAMAWAMALVFMPFLSLIPYLVFGRRRFDSYVKARRQADEEMARQAAELDWRPWIAEAMAAQQCSAANRKLRAMTALTGTPCVANNQVRLLINGEETFAAILGAIRGAQKVVLVQFFIIHDDALGLALQNTLLDRARAGVKVYLLYDAIGSHALPRTYVETLREAGCEVKGFSNRRGLINRFQVNFRNHRKIVVVDGEVGFTGGLNVGDEYMGLKPPLAPWRDTHLELRGPALATLQETFAQDWYWVTRRLPTLLLPERYEEGGVLCQVVPSGPADDQETCSLFFVEAIHSARHRIWITTPYFIPDEAVSAALRLAALRGVDVRILLPSRPDHKVVYAASYLYAFEAVHAGVRVFRYGPGFLHQKVVLIDEDVAAVGSANLDNRSFRLNFEVMVMVMDVPFAWEVRKMLEHDFSRSRELTPEDNVALRRWRRVAMRVARVFSPVL
ncbi:cardiolipin synthase [Pseudomonas oryzihabitans]|uniref:cardiolipin synthase n=1 Tax=Pseudomonas oryzihabitans TaxID=47885 RepID=UPI003EBC230C